jgi:flagellar motor switch protein FliG
MTDSPTPDQPAPADPTEVAGGGGIAQADPRMVAVRHAAMKLELLSADTRESILSRMDPSHAERVRDYLTSLPDRPHGSFSNDLATRRQMLHETANRLQARRTADADEELERLARGTAVPVSAPAGGMPMPGSTPPGMAPDDPLDRLRELHPAAIARAMQGERAEAWAIVLDRLEDNSRAALQLYLDATARSAIEEARERQAELARTSPALLATVVAAIARTVVPRAMREHHQLLSTTPLAWSGGAHGMPA